MCDDKGIFFLGQITFDIEIMLKVMMMMFLKCYLKHSTVFVTQGYGRADHSITQSVLKRKYGQYTITWSNEGY